MVRRFGRRQADMKERRNRVWRNRVWRNLV